MMFMKLHNPIKSSKHGGVKSIRLSGEAVNTKCAVRGGGAQNMTKIAT